MSLLFCNYSALGILTTGIFYIVGVFRGFIVEGPWFCCHNKSIPRQVLQCGISIRCNSPILHSGYSTLWIFRIILPRQRKHKFILYSINIEGISYVGRNVGNDKILAILRRTPENLHAISLKPSFLRIGFTHCVLSANITVHLESTATLCHQYPEYTKFHLHPMSISVYIFKIKPFFAEGEWMGIAEL